MQSFDLSVHSEPSARVMSRQIFWSLAAIVMLGTIPPLFAAPNYAGELRAQATRLHAKPMLVFFNEVSREQECDLYDDITRPAGFSLTSHQTCALHVHMHIYMM